MQRAGLLGDYDVLRLEVELANLEPAFRRAANASEAARRALAVEIGLEAVELDVVGSLASIDLVRGVDTGPLLSSFGIAASELAGVDRLLTYARQGRSDIRQIEMTERLRQTELRAEQSEYLPRISFFASYGYSAQADGGINPFGWGGARSLTNPQLGLQVTMPLFDGFRRPARTDQIRATIAQTRTQGSLVAAQVENQVRTLHDQVEEARLRAEGQEVAVARARRGYEIASAQFREGLGTRLELTDAEIALRQSEFNLAEAVHDYLTARVLLDQAVGAVPEVM
jgi:outer membrane protein